MINPPGSLPRHQKLSDRADDQSRATASVVLPCRSRHRARRLRIQRGLLRAPCGATWNARPSVASYGSPRLDFSGSEGRHFKVELGASAISGGEYLSAAALLPRPKT